MDGIFQESNIGHEGKRAMCAGKRMIIWGMVVALALYCHSVAPRKPPQSSTACIGKLFCSWVWDVGKALIADVSLRL